MELLYTRTSEKGENVTNNKQTLESSYMMQILGATAWLLCIDGVDIDVDLHGRLYFNFTAVLRADVLLFPEKHK